MKIQILCDNKNSWILPYCMGLIDELVRKGHDARIIHNANDVEEGEILILLSCEHIFRKLHLNKYNLVVHESALPAGKGWSPLTWQIIEGKDKIPVSLFEAGLKVDSGPIYEQILIDLEGTELVDELRNKQFQATRRLILNFISKYPNDIKGIEQKGIETFYRKRIPKDSRLNIHESILSQFNLLRVCDNERYPAYFEHEGIKYTIKIYKDIP